MTAIQKQHVDPHRKLLLRRKLLPESVAGAAWVPFIGDGDIADELYKDRVIWGADIDPERVAVAKQRLPNANIVTADCDSFGNFEDAPPFAIADFDAFGYPYAAFKQWWTHAPKTSTVVCFFTDTQLLSANRGNRYRDPEGNNHTLVPGTPEKKSVNNFYWARHVKPWIHTFTSEHDATILDINNYRRHATVYWGVVIDTTSKPAEKPEPSSTAKKRPGAPTKFNAQRQALYIEKLAAGMRRGAAARAVGLNPSTVRNTIAADPDLAERAMLAECEGDEEVEDALRTAALSGNVTACLAWLYSRQPERWQDRRMQRVESQVEQRIEVQVDDRSQREERLAQLVDLAAHREQGPG